MVLSDPLGLVVQAMQQGGYADRVKKLVYFTCTRTWTHDASKLSEEELKALLEQLCREHATLEELGQRFRDAIHRLNKKAEYARVAKLLLSKLQPLYQQSQSDPGTPLTMWRGKPRSSGQGRIAPPSKTGYDSVVAQSNLRPDRSEVTSEEIQVAVACPAQEPTEATQWRQTPSGAVGISGLQDGEDVSSSARDLPAWVAPASSLPLGYGGLQLHKQDYDPFELRAGVMQQTSPLRAKLVLFTALHHKLEPTVQGLAALRRYSLDELLRALYDACNSPQELEARLQQAVQQLQEPEQDSQAANAVLQMLRPLYVYVSQETMASGGLAAETPAADLDWLNGEGVTDGAESSRITWLESEIPKDGEATAEPPAFSAPALLAPELPEPCRQLLHRSAGSLMATIENTLSELGNALDEGLQDEDPAQYLSLKHQVLRGLLKDVEGSAALFRGILSRLEQSEWGLLRPAGIGGQPGEMAEMPLQVGDPYAALRQVLATSELARQKPQLEQEVMRLVRRSIGAIKTAIENALSELGQALDEQFQSRPLEEALVLKYQTLRTFLQEVEEISTKFAAFLARMEEAERRLFGLV